MSLIQVKTHQTNKHQVYIFWKREIPHNYMLSNLTGEQKVQFHQEKQWQTGKTPHWMKCAYQSKMQLSTQVSTELIILKFIIFLILI